MSESEKDIWQAHSMKFLEMAFRSDRQESLAHADGHGKKRGDCGDTVEFFLVVNEERIDTISYAINGCINTNACANAIIDLVSGKSLEQAWQTSPEDVATYLESLAEDHFHCAELAVGALYLALASVRETQKSPWKKLYRS